MENLVWGADITVINIVIDQMAGISGVLIFDVRERCPVGGLIVSEIFPRSTSRRVRSPLAALQ
jgi:hypothetical protein